MLHLFKECGLENRNERGRNRGKNKKAKKTAECE
jgi:hypothetical protein